jgi:hypothetical protein
MEEKFADGVRRWVSPVEFFDSWLAMEECEKAALGALGKSEDAKMKFWDDLSGKSWRRKESRRRGQERWKSSEKHGVYVKVPLEECWKETGREPIGARWVDINKGDKEKPEYRSRLVAQEIKVDEREDLFAATPPLEAKKMLVSIVASSRGMRDGKRMKLDFIDVRRAYFHARARRRVYVRLPPEDQGEGMRGRLEKAMYGTRDAAQNWEYEYVEFTVSLGFSQGKANPCVFYRPGRDLRVVVHGDDFTVGGFGEDLDWFRKRISEKFDVKFRARLGEGEKDDKSVRILNRVIEWKDDFGLVYEADQRHAEIIIRDLGLDGTSKAVLTPGVKEVSSEEIVFDANVVPWVSGEGQLLGAGSGRTFSSR